MSDRLKSVRELANMPGRNFVSEMKRALRADDYWEHFTDPLILERTRWALTTVLSSIDEQIEAEQFPARDWLNSIRRLRQICRLRLGNLPVNDGPVISGTREARAWRGFAALVAQSLAEVDPDALEALTAPYGGMNGLDWLTAHNRKKEAKVKG